MPVVKHCASCGKSFSRPPSRGAETCSMRCRDAWRVARRTMRACKACGVEFYRTHGELYCSRKCGHTSHTLPRTDPEPAAVDGARWLPLGKQRFALVDTDVFDRVNQWNWSVSARAAKGRKPYAHRADHSGGKPRWVKLHIYLLNPPAGMLVDHISGDTMDNRRSNLRLATLKQNSQNSISGASKSGFRGVHPENGRFLAHITTDKRCRRLGLFDAPEDAARAYDSEARVVQGAFARLNFPGPGEQPSHVFGNSIATP